MLLKRRDTFYFRWQVPRELRAILGRRELVKSLKTTDKLLAECRAVPFKLLVRKIKLKREELQMNDLTPDEQSYFEDWETSDNAGLDDPKLTQLTEDNYRQALQRVWEMALTESQQMANLRLENAGELKAYQKHLESSLEGYGETLFTQAGHPDSGSPNSLREFISDFRHDLATAGYRATHTEGDWGNLLLREYITIQGSIAKHQLEIFKERDESSFSFPGALVPKRTVELPEEGTPTALFSEVYERFLDFKINKQKRRLKPKMQADYRRFLADWYDLMDDRPIGSYTRREIKEYIFKLLDLPIRNRAPYNKMLASQILLLDDIPEDIVVEPKTVGQVRRWMQGVFKFAINEYTIEQSPVRDLGVNLESEKSYGDFKDEEVVRMLDYASKFEGWQKWVMTIAAYTGMRKTEIIQLCPDNVQLDSKSGRYYFLITDRGPDQTIKNENARRQVPIHKKLLEMDFLGFVENADERLFPGLKPKRVIDWYNRAVSKACDIPEVNDFENRLKFHSFRTTVITKLRGEGTNTALVQQIVGHQKTSAGITDTYTQPFQIRNLVPVVDSLEY